VGRAEMSRGGPPGGHVHTYAATFRDIVPAERIVYAYTMEADDTLGHVARRLGAGSDHEMDWIFGSIAPAERAKTSWPQPALS
jgi:uncharacterized protein YndB with AHSA1/START domain